MNTTIAEGLALVDAMLPRLQSLSSVERVVCPPFVSLPGDRRSAARHRDRRRRPEHVRRAERRLYRRNRAGHARRAGDLRHPRPLRATPVLRRRRRARQPQSQSRARQRRWCRSCASAKASSRTSAAKPKRSSARQVRAALDGRRAPVGGRDRLRADLGDRHRPRRDARRRQRHHRLDPTHGRRDRRASRSPKGCRSSTAAASPPRTSPPSSPNPISTARWSAAPA